MGQRRRFTFQPGSKGEGFGVETDKPACWSLEGLVAGLGPYSSMCEPQALVFWKWLETFNLGPQRDRIHSVTRSSGDSHDIFGGPPLQHVKFLGQGSNPRHSCSCATTRILTCCTTREFTTQIYNLNIPKSLASLIRLEP